MASDRTRTDPHDGVRVTRKRGRSLIVPSMLAVAAVGWLVGRALRSETAEQPAPRSQGAVTPSTAVPSAPPAAARDGELAERVRQRREERQLNRREKTEPRFTENAPGEHAGMAVCPPPGTKPIKHGIVVPDDFELPEGYVRHYQTTDDGRRLPPILMFHPDFAGVDENGRPIVVPEDRIVPPELAPPGLPRRMLDETTDVDERVGRRVNPEPAVPTGRR